MIRYGRGEELLAHKQWSSCTRAEPPESVREDETFFHGIHCCCKLLCAMCATRLYVASAMRLA